MFAQKKAYNTYLLLVGLSTKPKLILPYSMYCQSVLHTCLQKLSQCTLLVFKQISGRAIFLFFQQPINSKKKPLLKFIYSKKATKFCEIFTLLLSYVVPVKSKVKISQNFVAFSEYMNFKGEKDIL